MYVAVTVHNYQAAKASLGEDGEQPAYATL
jgi:hypothetical protein